MCSVVGEMKKHEKNYVTRKKGKNKAARLKGGAGGRRGLSARNTKVSETAKHWAGPHDRKDTRKDPGKKYTAISKTKCRRSENTGLGKVKNSGHSVQLSGQDAPFFPTALTGLCGQTLYLL